MLYHELYWFFNLSGCWSVSCTFVWGWQLMCYTRKTCNFNAKRHIFSETTAWRNLRSTLTEKITCSTFKLKLQYSDTGGSFFSDFVFKQKVTAAYDIAGSMQGKMILKVCWRKKSMTFMKLEASTVYRNGSSLWANLGCFSLLREIKFVK